jgi:hypothetical protein
MPAWSSAIAASAGTISTSSFEDASRLTYTEPLADERKHSATAPLARAFWFTRHGVTVGRVMTDHCRAAGSTICRSSTPVSSEARPFLLDVPLIRDSDDAPYAATGHTGRLASCI